MNLMLLNLTLLTWCSEPWLSVLFTDAAPLRPPSAPVGPHCSNAAASLQLVLTVGHHHIAWIQSGGDQCRVPLREATR
jgi:hypothetical protein